MRLYICLFNYIRSIEEQKLSDHESHDGHKDPDLELDVDPVWSSVLCSKAKISRY